MLVYHSSSFFFRWVKFGELKNVSIMNKDVICFGTGCHIKFHDLGTQDRKTLTANFPSINGEGVRVVEGHRTTYTFAYADYCENPSIFVKNYPDFYEMSVFRSRYLCTFSSEPKYPEEVTILKNHSRFIFQSVNDLSWNRSYSKTRF